MTPPTQTLAHDRHGRPVLRTTWTKRCGQQVVHDQLLVQPARVRDALALGVAAVLLGLGVALPFASAPLSGGTGWGVILILLGVALAWRTLHRLGRLP